MARSARTWTALLGDIRLLLGETDAAASVWSDALLLLLMNTALDYRASQLSNVTEGWTTVSLSVSLVAGTNSYTLNSGGYAPRIRRVLRVYTVGSGTVEVPLFRDERWYEGVSNPTSTTTGSNVVPSYRMIGATILLEPTPTESVTNGLRVEYDTLHNRFTTGADTIPSYFPDVAESLLIYDVVALALRQEGSMGEMKPDGFMNHLLSTRAEYERVFLEYAEDRISSPVAAQPFTLGD